MQVQTGAPDDAFEALAQAQLAETPEEVIAVIPCGLDDAYGSQNARKRTGILPAGHAGRSESSASPHLPVRARPKVTASWAKVLASGQSVLQSEHGFIYEVFPDGRKVKVKAIEPPTLVTPGSKFTIR